MRRQALCLTVLLLGGCVSLPEKAQPEAVKVPENWQAKIAESVTPDGSVDWLAALGDEALRALVVEALEGNFDLRATAQRLEAARQAVMVAGASRLPQLGVGFDAARQKTHVISDGSTGVPAGVVSQTKNSFMPGLNVSWELDLWGRLADAREVALQEALASEAVYVGARLSLATSIAQEWFNAIAAVRQEALARETLNNITHVNERIETLYQRGTAEALELRLSRANLANARAVVAERARQRKEAVRALELLLGRYPLGVLPVGEDLPATLPEVPVGLPSEMLERRPDLAEARARLEAAYARANEARKLALPSISLTGNYGTGSNELRNVLDGDYTLWSLALGLTQPIFQGGRIEAGARAAKADWLAQWEAYRAVLNNAFGEVENALAAEAYFREQAEAYALAVDESIEAERLAWERYERGLVDMMTVLEAQRRAFDAQSGLIEARRQVLANRLALYLALGGDFMLPEPAAATQTALPENS